MQRRPFRVREEINLHFQESRRPHGKARGGRIAGYLTDAQRGQAGWIGALKCEVIFERALSTCIRKYDDVLKVGFRCQVSGMEIAIAET